MKISGNSLSLAAMGSSIILLLALEAFWLTNEYREQLNQFHRETHMLLRNTVFELNDSLIQKGLVKVDLSGSSLDSLPGDPRARIFQMKIDSSSQIIFSKGRQDEPIPHRKNMMIRVHFDSIDQDVIAKRYQVELSKAGLDLPVHVMMIDELVEEGKPVLFSKDIIRTPNGAFKLEFSNIDWLILKKITPQILFSLFLTLLVIGSFFLLYRNLRLQQRLVEIKDGLISNISHELKTPITTVGVALEGLRNFKGQSNPEVTNEYLSIAEHELKRLSLLTERVLHTSIADHHLTSKNASSFDFGELLEEVRQSFRLIAEKAGASIQIEKLTNNLVVTGDRDHLATVLFNLVDNALKYSKEKATILIRLEGDENYLIFTVQDNGIGIPKEFHDKIFEKFFRVPTGDIHLVKGYGLGLNYVHQIVKAHGGNIVVRSTPGEGSSFIITLSRHAKK